MEVDIPVKFSRNRQAEVVLPNSDPTKEERQANCISIEDDQYFQDYIFDFRMIVSDIIQYIDVKWY